MRRLESEWKIQKKKIIDFIISMESKVLLFLSVLALKDIEMSLQEQK